LSHVLENCPIVFAIREDIYTLLKTINFTFVKSHTYIHVLSSFATKVTSFPRGWPCSILAAAHLLFISRSFNVINATYPQFYHDLITMRGAMPTHLGTNPRNHVKHDYSCSSLENFYYYCSCVSFQDQELIIGIKGGVRSRAGSASSWKLAPQRGPKIFKYNE